MSANRIMPGESTARLLGFVSRGYINEVTNPAGLGVTAPPVLVLAGVRFETKFIDIRCVYSENDPQTDA